MSRLTVAVAGSASSFVLAAVAGVLGNQLKPGAWWFWLAFTVTLLVGAGITAAVAHRAERLDGAGASNSVTHHGNTAVGKVTTENGPAIGINYGTVNGSRTDHG